MGIRSRVLKGVWSADATLTDALPIGGLHKLGMKELGYGPEGLIKPHGFRV